MRKLFFVLPFVISLSFACSKKADQFEANGIVRDLTGLDGCGLMIVLDTGGSLEIISLPPNIVLIADRRVEVKYKPVPRMSACMAGTTAEIISLRYL